MNFNATGLAAGSCEDFLCISSNDTDPDEPKPAVPANVRARADDVYADGFETP